MATCPNCGGDTATSIEYDGETVAPDGGIEVCVDCHMAVDPNVENPNEGMEQPDATLPPRGEPGPERVEDAPDFNYAEYVAEQEAVAPPEGGTEEPTQIIEPEPEEAPA